MAIEKPIIDSSTRMGRSEWGWSLFQAGRDPYVVLCTIYILVPYIASTVIGDSVQGQQMVALWNLIAGLAVAATAPFLGSIADQLGRRKPLLILITIIMSGLIGCLWWAVPPAMGGLPIAAIGLLIVLIGMMFAFNEVIHNSMLPGASNHATLPMTSGMAHVTGSIVSVSMLLFILWAFAFPGHIKAPGIPDAPLFGLDASTHETSRIVAPIVAVFMLVACLPLWFNTRDGAPTGISIGKAISKGVADLKQTLSVLFKDHSNAARYLIARMLYTDGKTALLVFGGVVAAGVLGWGLEEMTSYGIIMSIFAIGGGLLAGKLDSGIGPKRAIQLEIGFTIAALIGMSTITPKSILFFPVTEGQAVWASPIFSTLPELVFLAVAATVAVSITAAYSSSRTMLTRVTPVGMEGQFFGMYALAGAATAWLGPLLVGIITAVTQNQQAGLFSILLLLGAGFILMAKVKEQP
jgi:MFS transporter, UMF1 family